MPYMVVLSVVIHRRPRLTLDIEFLVPASGPIPWTAPPSPGVWRKWRNSTPAGSCSGMPMVNRESPATRFLPILGRTNERGRRSIRNREELLAGWKFLRKGLGGVEQFNICGTFRCPYSLRSSSEMMVHAGMMEAVKRATLARLISDPGWLP
jgi:hypothetical protein